MPEYGRRIVMSIGNNSTGMIMNPPGPIRGNGPHGSGQMSCDIFSRFKIFYSFDGISDISNRILHWHDESFSETEACKRIFKNSGRKNSEVLLQEFTAESTNIEPPYQHKMSDPHLLQKIPSWDTSVPQVNMTGYRIVCRNNISIYD